MSPSHDELNKGIVRSHELQAVQLVPGVVVQAVAGPRGEDDDVPGAHPSVNTVAVGITCAC